MLGIMIMFFGFIYAPYTDSEGFAEDESPSLSSWDTAKATMAITEITGRARLRLV